MKTYKGYSKLPYCNTYVPYATPALHSLAKSCVFDSCCLNPTKYLFTLLSGELPLASSRLLWCVYPPLWKIRVHWHTVFPWIDPRSLLILEAMDAARTKQGRVQIKGTVYKLKHHPRVHTARVDFAKTKSKLKLLYYCDLSSIDYIYSSSISVSASSPNPNQQTDHIIIRFNLAHALQYSRAIASVITPVTHTCSNPPQALCSTGAGIG